MLVGSVLLIAGVLIGKTSYRTGLPLLLVFLLVGMGFGCDGLGIQFGDMHQAQMIGMVALCIILFSGGMSTSVSSIRRYFCGTGAFHYGCAAYGIIDRPVHILVIRNGVDQYTFCHHSVIAVGGYHVQYRFCFGVRYTWRS